MRDIVPSVTMSAQATLLTGQPVEKHGIVGNGWLFRDTNEIRFWQQSNRLIQAEPNKGARFRLSKQRDLTPLLFFYSVKKLLPKMNVPGSVAPL